MTVRKFDRFSDKLTVQLARNHRYQVTRYDLDQIRGSFVELTIYSSIAAVEMVQSKSKTRHFTTYSYKIASTYQDIGQSSNVQADYNNKRLFRGNSEA